MSTPSRLPSSPLPRAATALRALVVTLALLAACSSEDSRCEGSSCEEGPCSGVTCGEDGRCEVAGGVAVCHCRRGYDAVALECVPAGEDLCARAPCTAGCTVTPEGARCQCREGERSTGLGCVVVSAPACAGVACSGHGRCQEIDGRASCACDEGYAPSADGLGCVRVPPPEACVAVNEPRCAPGHGLSVCCRGTSCAFRFEDGKVLRGLGAAATYCKGRITSLDGACRGTPVACETLNGQEEPCWNAQCRYEPGTGACEETGARTCDVLLEPRICHRLAGCQWEPSPVDEDLATIDDGVCAGEPLPCETHAGDPSACRLAGCTPVPGACVGNVSNTCSKHGTRGTCEKASGCRWIAPRASDDWRCGPTTGLCKEGRSHDLCCDNACEARFEDGTTMRGAESTIGYCLGAIDRGAEDGSCISACWQLRDAAACESAESCRWNAEASLCEGTELACFGGYDRQSCTARPGCAWIDAGGSTSLPAGPDVSNDEYVPDTIALPVLSSPPFPPGTPCPEECGHGCLLAAGKVVIDQSGRPKPLPNMTFCIAAGTPLLAVAPGEVVSVDTTYVGEGDYAVIIRSSENPNFSFVYDHVSAVTVTVGAIVKPGDPIALGQVSGAVSTFELQINEVRGPQPHQVFVSCPARYATSEVNAAMTALLLAGHVSSSENDWNLVSWALCDRAWVQGY